MARPRQVLLSPQAAADLDEIYGPVYSEVLARLELLARFPELGGALTGHLAGWRATNVRMFRIIYRVVPKAVEVAYIRHCRRRTPDRPTPGS